MKFKIFKFKTVTSTNDVAIRLIKKNKSKSGCVFSEIQTKGRGTRGKRWISQKGNLFSSIFFPLKKNFPSFSEFSIINPIILSKVIENFSENKKISFKWPNDVFLNKKKICGILQEIITLNNNKFLIIGIGLNVVSNPLINTKYKTTSIYMETKIKPSAQKIIKIIINSYEDFFKNLKSYNYAEFKKKANSLVLN